MWRCRTVDRLFRLIPFGVWQDLLVRMHMLRCPACSKKLATVEEAKAWLIQEKDLAEDIRDALPAVHRLSSPGTVSKADPGRPRWRWAAVAAGLMAVAMTAFWLFQPGGPSDPTAPDQRLRIDYVEIDSRPARAYVYQTQDADMTLVWVEKGGEGEAP